MTPVVTVVLPDPAALSWDDRAWLRTDIADAIRMVCENDEPVGVDLVPEDA